MGAMRRRVAGSTFERARQGRRHTPRMTAGLRDPKPGHPERLDPGEEEDQNTSPR